MLAAERCLRPLPAGQRELVVVYSPAFRFVNRFCSPLATSVQEFDPRDL